MKTDYAGINYALGTDTNRNPETGIRYGIISLESLHDYAFEDLATHGEDTDFNAYVQEIRTTARDAIESALSDYPGRLRTIVADAAADAAEENCGEYYEQTSDYPRYRYEYDGYILHTTGDGQVFVIRSPFTTHAQFCSPCVSGAGNLDSPCDSGPECYCFGPEWFDDEHPMPYVATRIEDEFPETEHRY